MVMFSIYSYSWPILFSIICTIYLVCPLLILKRNLKIKKLPPGPKGLPILGNLHLIGKRPHHDMHKLAMEHGDIMSLQFGLVQIVVVSSPSAARLFLETHDNIFASRSLTHAGKYIYNRKGLVSSQYGHYWRCLRKLCTLQLLSTARIASFSPMRRREVSLMVEKLKKSSGELVDISAVIGSLSTNLICLMVFGKKYGDEDFDQKGLKAAIREMVSVATNFNLSDFAPFLGVLDLQGIGKKIKALVKVFDRFFDKIIDEHINTTGNKEDSCFVHVLLSNIAEFNQDGEVTVDMNNVKALLLDLILAGGDATAMTIEWALSELLRNPSTMKKAQEELKNVVSMQRTVEEADLAHLPYLDMVLKETFRLHPVAPLLLPHYSMEDCTINGFYIPKSTRIIVNVWAIGRDPAAWPDPETFYPERFSGSNVDVRGRDFQLIPFGSGRRSCPGMQLGLITSRLVLAQLLHCFDWELPRGVSPHELDMSEEFGLALSRATPLQAIPIHRLIDQSD